MHVVCSGVLPDAALGAAAHVFKVLGHESRLQLLVLLAEEPRTVGALESATGLSQPLVSQHLRVLRQSGLVTTERLGREVRYHVADRHVAHVVADALEHARENASPASP